MWRILLGEFWGELRSQTTRAALTVLAIAWGTCTVVMLLALGEGLKRRMITQLLAAYDQTIVLSGGVTNQPFQGLAPGRRIQFTEEDVLVIRQNLDGLDAISPAYYRYNVAKATEAANTVVRQGRVEGVYPEYGRVRNIAPADGGRFLNERDQAERRRVAFLGDSLAARLFPEGNALGERLLLNNQPFTVVGIARPRLEASFEFEDVHRVLIPAATFVAVFGISPVNEILLRPTAAAAGETLEPELRRLLGWRHRFEPTDRRALRLTDWGETARTANRIFLGIQAFLGLLGGLTLFAAGVGVANIMFVAVQERTREIGIKMAIGARRRHVMAQFVFEALALALAGGALGLAAGAGGVALVGMVPKEHEILQYVLHPTISWEIGIATMVVLTLIGLAAGLFPARRAAAVDPVESLRYE